MRIFQLIAMCVVALGLSPAGAADIYPFTYGTGSLRDVVIEGRIEAGDLDRFLSVVKDGQGQVRTVVLFSAGGDFEEAMKIGRALRKLEMTSIVPARNDRGEPLCGYTEVIPKPKDPHNCTAASAAFFIHIGSVMRSGLYLVVHRPYFASRDFGQLSESDAKRAFDALQEKSRLYMDEMGVPKRVQEDVLGTASDKGLVLDNATVRTHFLGELPYYHEWMRNKCAVLDEDESRRNSEYRARLLSNCDMRKLVITPEEMRDFQALQAKEKREADCGISAGKARAMEAYAQFFGSKPSDSSGYAFEAWPAQLAYLGKPMDDLLAGEKMEQETMMGRRILTRPAGAAGPYLLIYDSPGTPGVAYKLSAISAPNPTPEFNDKLLSALEVAWSKAQSTTATVKTWLTPAFEASLDTGMRSGDGVSTVLHLRSR